MRGEGAFLFLSLGRLRGGRQMGGFALSVFLGRVKQGLSLERWLLRPAGAAAFLFLSLGRLRGGRQMGALLGAAAPPRPPLHSPRITPRGLSNFRYFTRAARLLLRELPRFAR